jgi:hypothetical protein
LSIVIVNCHRHLEREQAHSLASLIGVVSPFRLAIPISHFRLATPKLGTNSLTRECLKIEEKKDRMKKMTIDDVLAKQAYRLSLDEREEVLDDLHGITEEEASQDLISRALTALDEEIKQISIKLAYEQALLQSPGYVNDPKLRLQFLRADKFDHKSAAKRLVSFFEAKMELFGPEKVGQVIKLKDLSVEDRAVLETGVIQALPGGDNAGRAVCFQYLELQRFPNAVENHLVTFGKRRGTHYHMLLSLTISCYLDLL